jgi:outer membrane murein-binding lipoprotein Lpp
VIVAEPLKRCVMNSKLKLVGVLGVVWLSGCASQADEDSNNRITSAADYKLFDCPQLAQHARDLSAQAAALPSVPAVTLNAADERST